MARGTFALDLAKFAEKVGDRANDACALLVVKVAAGIDKLSPVGDATYWKSKPPKGYVGGHFRANWQLGIGSLPSGTVPGVDRSDKGDRGGATTSLIAAAIPEEAAGPIYYIANNLPYAIALEYGHSRQAPHGMVGVTVARIQATFAEAVSEAKGLHP